jgi:putative flippase GtrA
MSCANVVTTGRPAAQPADRPRQSEASAAWQYLRFCVVGLSNALVDLGVLNSLLLLHPTHSTLILLADNTLAVCLAIVNSYLWNTRWTFRGQVTHDRRERTLFVGQAALNVATNNLVLLAMASVLPPTLGIVSLLGSNLAKLAAMLVASTTSFLLLRTVVFRPRTAHSR